MTTLTPISLGAPPSALAANLAAMGARSPRAAEAVRAARSAPLEWTETGQPGAPSASIDGRALASRRRPLDEAEAFAAGADLHKAGAVVVLGFGLGYHIAALARRAKRHTLVIVYEPDATVLRAALERADFSRIFTEHNVIVLTEADAGPALTRAVQGAEPLMAIGVQFMEHAPSVARLRASAPTFTEAVTRVVASLRTQVITTMVQMDVTVRNLLMNADHYAFRPGVDDLAGVASGRPAVVISAGPSLQRNLDLLAQPGVRDRVVIVAVQTVLKPLLARGIRPHFVTALDYHEISRRFYEGLTAADVEGVTLVAEPKANAAILEAFPGEIRLIGSSLLDLVLGRELAGAHAELPPGATVAHLAYSLARHLGADPVILIGQDLAFTDGRYYAPGAAIHDVWAPELNPFNTLETMEWQRIVRWRGHLHRRSDQFGRPVYTDDQMSTYLAQFEGYFSADAERGLTTIDATEGGVSKASTRAMSLREALERYARPSGCDPRLMGESSERGASPSKARQLRNRIDHLRRDVRLVAEGSKSAAGLLERMPAVRHDERRLNALIDEVHRVRGRVQRLGAAYEMVQRLNQAGAFKRFRADRLLALAEELTPFEQQGRQIERDLMNVRWLGDAAKTLDELLGATLAAIDGAPRLTRDPPPPAPETLDDNESNESAPSPARPKARVVGAIVVADLAMSSLGTPRDLTRPIGERSALQRTLDRLSRCALLRDAPVCHLTGDTAALTEHFRATRGTRAWARNSWRGGIGGATVYDELIEPRLIKRVMEERRLDAALIVGGDWALVEPALCDAIIERHRENPGAHPLSFSQAPPGLAGIVVSAEFIADLARGREAGDPFATIGGVLGYNPRKPRTDPVAAPACVQLDASVRQCAERFIPDSPDRVALIEAILESDAASASDIVRFAESFRAEHAPLVFEEMVLELSRSGHGDRQDMPIDWVVGIIEQSAALNPALAITLGSDRSDAMLHPGVFDAIDAAVRAGLSMHIRTELRCDAGAVDRLAASGVHIVSIDLHAGSRETYRRVRGVDHYDRVVENIDRLLRARGPLVVPRLLKRDAVYEEVEGFFDRATLVCSWAVLDQFGERPEGERLQPLGKPVQTARRDWRSRMLIDGSGEVPADEIGRAGWAATIGEHSLVDAWRALQQHRLSAWRSDGDGHPDLRTGW